MAIIKFFKSKFSFNASFAFFFIFNDCDSSIFTMNTFKKSDNTRFIVVGLASVGIFI